MKLINKQRLGDCVRYFFEGGVQCLCGSDGRKIWYINNMLHREDGPAVVNHKGEGFWYLNNKLHREDGPAVKKGNEISYFLDNVCYAKEEYEFVIKRYE